MNIDLSNIPCNEPEPIICHVLGDRIVLNGKETFGIAGTIYYNSFKNKYSNNETINYFASVNEAIDSLYSK